MATADEEILMRDTQQDDGQRQQQDSTKPVHLDPSPLGSKAYWSSLYSSDLQTRQSSIPTHTGITWFDDAGAEEKIIRYLSALLHLPTTASSAPQLSLPNTSFLDLGTGNGSLLFALRRRGWAGAMIGVDYAEESVDLASSIWKGIVESGWELDSIDEDSDGEKQGEAPSMNRVDFQTLDILSLKDATSKLPDWTPRDGFDVVLDKGTFDAVSLSSDIDSSTGKRVAESYAIAARRFLKRPNGRMIVTSCNWTESELERWFSGVDDQTSGYRQSEQLRVLDRVPYRKFQFGGKEGSVVVGLVFGWAGLGYQANEQDLAT